MLDWEDLRHFLAIARAGTLSGAARALKVDHATVSRRLAALENSMQIQLVDRQPRACRLTDAGRDVAKRLEHMEANAYAIERIAHAGQSSLTGKVVLSAPPVLVSNFLAKQLLAFRQQHPGLQLSLAGEQQSVSLGRREADIAIRLARPEELDCVARKLGTLHFALYASRNYEYLRQPSSWEFISYDTRQGESAQQKWLQRIAGKRPMVCAINDITSHYAAARAGAGVAALPCFLGDADDTLQRVAFDGCGFSRDIWLVAHRDLKRSPPIRAVMDFLIEMVAESPMLKQR